MSNISVEDVEEFKQNFNKLSKQIINQKYETESTRYLVEIKEDIIKLLKEGITRADILKFTNALLTEMAINHTVTASDFDKFLKQINFKKGRKRSSK